MPRPKSDKDPYENLDEDFKDAVASMKEEDIRKKIAEVALNQAAMDQAMENDLDLQEKKEQLKVCTEPYSEARKANKLKIKYCRQILENQGKDTGTAEVE